MEKTIIAVCGATGTVGGAVINSLLKNPQWQIRALTRSPFGDKAMKLKDRGIDIIKADLNNRESMVKAFQGAAYVFGITQPFINPEKGSGLQNETEQGYNIIDSCFDNKVRHLVMSTVLTTDYHGELPAHLKSKITIVNYLRHARLNYTILRPGSFMENIGKSFFPVKKSFVRGFTDHDTILPYISADDIGEIAAIVFEKAPEFNTKEINLATELVSGDDLAKIIMRIRGGGSFRYKSTPRILMKFFARDFYLMRLLFEQAGKGKVPDAYLEAVNQTRQLLASPKSMAQYLTEFGVGI